MYTTVRRSRFPAMLLTWADQGGLDSIVDERQEDESHQRPRRHNFREAGVSRLGQTAALLDSRGWVLRMENAGTQEEATLLSPAERRPANRLRGHLGLLEG